MTSNLVWFRQDLRAADNTALIEACRDPGAEVFAVFIATPKQWLIHDMADIRRDYILRQVDELAQRLRLLNIPLLIREAPSFTEVPAVLAELVKQYSINRVFANREYGWNEKCRDQVVAEELSKHSCDFVLSHDQTIVRPGLTTKAGKPYTVFTPFKRQWLIDVELSNAGARPTPERRTATELIKKVLGSLITSSRSVNEQWPAGEAAAQRKLTDFCAARIDDYKLHRDMPDIEGTSTLSADLAAGSISTRQCLDRALEANHGRFSGGSAGVDTWISELIWRDFYIHILDSFPRVGRHRAFRLETEGIPWRQADDDFAAWCNGMTGFPIVDAGMRQLRATGWMHNRLRMVVAMFLSKQLLINWQRGEQFFMQNLIDGHLASNNGGWQWAASTGTDAAPYFRIFNPVRQGQRFDPEGNFVRRYCPELASLSAREIHMPSQERLTDLGIDYPGPIVDLREGRARALSAFQTASAMRSR
jgi:deoxyribodipyrimidine photo-lyase